MKLDVLTRLRLARAALSDDGLLSLPPSGSCTEFGHLLWTFPRPLIFPDAKLLVVCAQKAAYTNVVIWYFHQIGHAKAARDFHDWPHQYLLRVFNYSELYRNAYDLDLSEFTVVRIVRDPARRTVSSYRHALKHGYANADIARQIGCRDIASHGLSFSMFLDFLEKLDISTCNEHFRLQRHPIEDKLPVHHLINVTTEDLFARLNEIESDLGLQPTNMVDDPWIKFVKFHNRPKKVLDEADDVYTRLLTPQQANLGPWPGYDDLLTPEARERINLLYAVDYETYMNDFDARSPEPAS